VRLNQLQQQQIASHLVHCIAFCIAHWCTGVMQNNFCLRTRRRVNSANDERFKKKIIIILTATDDGQRTTRRIINNLQFLFSCRIITFMLRRSGNRITKRPVECIKSPSRFISLLQYFYLLLCHIKYFDIHRENRRQKVTRVHLLLHTNLNIRVEI